MPSLNFPRANIDLEVRNMTGVLCGDGDRTGDGDGDGDNGEKGDGACSTSASLPAGDIPGPATTSPPHPSSMLRGMGW